MDRRKFIQNAGFAFAGLAASGSLLSCVGNGTNRASKSYKKLNMPQSSNKLYIGDLHNHCNLTYGHGDMRDAFEAAKQQLDFLAVTPHALWPDIPGKDDPRLAWVIDYHVQAFIRLRKEGWPKYVAMTREYNKENEFITFLSYECHSMKHGDHVVLNYDLDAPLLECTSVEDLKRQLMDKKAYVTPHHMGYQEGYRGYDWEFFSPEKTPFVEMFSRHGLAEMDEGDYPYLHDMGPRRWTGTALYGLMQGHKFGIMGSTDQHAGYPGSYGDGRIVLLAPSLTRDALWSSLGNRKMYCVTGDKIAVDFRINDAEMGEVVRGNRRKIYLNVQAGGIIDYVDLVKNGKTVARMGGDLLPAIPREDTVRVKMKVEFGWNRETKIVEWNGKLRLTDGEIHGVETCFRGAPYTAPQEGKKEKDVTYVNKLLSQSSREVELKMYSTKNPNVLTPATQAVIIDATVPKSAKLVAEFNGKTFEHSVEDLLHGGETHFMIGWLSEAIQFHRAAPQASFCIEHYMEDNEPERDTDFYYVRVRQRDAQWAWSTPIWVERT